MPTFQDVLGSQSEQIAKKAQEMHESIKKGGDLDDVVKQADEVGSLTDDLAKRVTQARQALEGQEEQEEESS